ncbi:uncharacterized protein MYCFIDRAFT_130445 [Pseudocercospora fijiensis CIRAD86]|uniref:Acyclic terpene utilisation N-terminal domain-containing protein n=1 Tax=Pseudocercospora fijiensis (strain CIRAD86) TaxID=383855 RepID=M3BBR6_PSEFD|nr:uncharacterized protein MYCFIDRAFT_130445 [Pseudocercospora fijiensis CIRAD86]EME86648.1 hypothetical protein MYCFIDRAFT_130445 [Pseudocercospora fijiensis CIRAD86]
MSPSTRRPVRIGGASGGFTDRVRAINSLASNEDVDVIVGDWLSEMTRTIHGSGKQRTIKDLSTKSQTFNELSFEQQLETAYFAENFMDCFEPAIDSLAKNGVKLAVNAGASDTEVLAKLVQQTVKAKGYDLKVAWISGDEQTENVRELISRGETFESLMHGRKIQDWEQEIVCAQCYLGGLGIAEALRAGADIVIAGRVADAAPTIGAAAWWHEWSRDQLDELAGSLDLLKTGKHVNVGFPIAAVDYRGNCTITKEKNTGGCVTVDSVTSQLLYEIQGPLYYNSDVVAHLEGVKIEQLGEDEVFVSGVKGLPPPDTTKVGISGFAGWQAEYHIYLCGLDIDEKCKFAEDQIKYELGEERLNKFSCLKFTRNGDSPIDARNQDIATVDFRIFAQSKDRQLLSMRNPEGFFRISMVNFLMSCPGATLSNDMRQAEGKPFYEYWPALLPQTWVKHQAHLLFEPEAGKQKVIDIPPPTLTEKHKRQQPSYETSNPAKLSALGETVRAPLGTIVLGRSGDKASDCNVGFFVRPSPNDELWEWLRTILTVEKIKELLGPEEIHKFGKAELRYLRAKTVDIPKKFLEYARI